MGGVNGEGGRGGGRGARGGSPFNGLNLQEGGGLAALLQGAGAGAEWEGGLLLQQGFGARGKAGAEEGGVEGDLLQQAAAAAVRASLSDEECSTSAPVLQAVEKERCVGGQGVGPASVMGLECPPVVQERGWASNALQCFAWTSGLR